MDCDPCFPVVVDVFDTDSYVSIDSKLAAMVRKIASCGSQSVFRTSRYFCLILVPE